MLLLTSTSDKLQLKTSAAKNVAVQASFVDYTSGAITPGRTNTAISTATTTDIVAAPASSTQRTVKHVSALNIDTASDDVTLIHTDGTTAVELIKTTLAPGEAIHYVEDYGFKVFDAEGRGRGSFLPSPQMPSITLGPGYCINNSVTNVFAPITGQSAAVFMGKAPSDLSAITFLYRVTTLAATITWAEISVGVCPGLLNAVVPRITFAAFADVSAVVNTTGVKTTQLTGLNIKEGDGLWAIYAISATTLGALRAVSLSNDSWSNTNEATTFAALASSTRPSSNIGNAVPWTTNASNAPLFAMKFS